MEYTLNHFIRKFESIPERKWCTGVMSKRTIFGVKKDAIGFCLPKEILKAFRIAKGKLNLSTDLLNSYPELKALITLFGFVKTQNGTEQVINLVNDGYTEEFRQPTPKQRVLAFLYRLQAKNLIEERKMKIKAMNSKEIVLPTIETMNDRFEESKEALNN